MIKTEPVQRTVKWEIKKEEEEGERKGGRTEESKQGYKGKGMLGG